MRKSIIMLAQSDRRRQHCSGFVLNDTQTFETQSDSQIALVVAAKASARRPIKHG
jgi:hypothetical protein